MSVSESIRITNAGGPIDPPVCPTACSSPRPSVARGWKQSVKGADCSEAGRKKTEREEPTGWRSQFIVACMYSQSDRQSMPRRSFVRCLPLRSNVRPDGSVRFLPLCSTQRVSENSSGGAAAAHLNCILPAIAHLDCVCIVLGEQGTFGSQSPPVGPCRHDSGFRLFRYIELISFKDETSRDRQTDRQKGVNCPNDNFRRRRSRKKESGRPLEPTCAQIESRVLSICVLSRLSSSCPD